MPLFAKLKRSVEAKKESYEAVAAMIACLVVAGVFAIGAAAIWVAEFLGPIASCLIFSAGFLVLALCFKIISGSKDTEAHEDLKTARRNVSNTVQAVSGVVRSTTAEVKHQSGSLPTLFAGAVLLALIYFAGRNS